MSIRNRIIRLDSYHRQDKIRDTIADRHQVVELIELFQRDHQEQRYPKRLGA